MPLHRAPAAAIQFAGGIETKTDSKQVPPVQLLNLENATFIKQTTLAKRNGYRALSKLIDTTSAEYGTARGMAERDSELLVFTDDGHAYSYRDSVDRWHDTGSVMSVTARQAAAARSGTHQTMGDAATNGGVQVVAWEDSRGGVYCSVLEASSGQMIQRDVQLDGSTSAISPRVIPCGTVVHVLWARSDLGQILCAVVNPAAPESTITSSAIIADLNPANPVYDAAFTGSTQYADIGPGIIAWAEATGGWRVAYIAPSGVLGSPVTGLPTSATFADACGGPIAVSYDKVNEQGIAIAWCNSTTMTIRAVTITDLTLSIGSDFTDAVATNAVRCTLEFGGLTGVLAPFRSALYWAVDRAGARDDLNSVATGAVTIVGAELVAARTLLGHGLVSRAFHDQGNVYVAVGHGVQFFPYVAIVQLSAADFGEDTGTAAMARLEPGSFDGLPARHHVTSSQAVDPDATGLSRQHAICLPFRIQLSSENGDQFSETGIRIATLDFDDTAAYQWAQLGRGLYMAGACNLHYDGVRWAEAEFHCAPDVATGAGSIATASGSGGSMASATYGYKVTYEEMDALGEWHPGAVSVETNVAVTSETSAGSVTLELPTCRLTNKKNVRIGVYRSPGNQTGDPDSIPFYRVTSTSPADLVGNNRFVPNDMTVDSISFTDGLDDVALKAREPLYTNGGILSNSPSPSAGRALAVGKSRLYWPDPADPHLVRFSQEIADDTGLEAPIDLSLRCDPYGGGIVAIGIMDGAVYAFKDTAIYVFGGPGPDRDGGKTTQDAFTAPELVTSDVGCKSPASICQTPEGIVFQSQKGIKLLDRQRNVQDIGASVYAFNDQTVVRATLLPDRHQVVFLTNSGYTLLWDYEKKQWSKFTNHEGLDAVVVGGVYHYLRTDGRVFVETPGVYQDDNSHIRMTIETAWIKMAGYLQGWQRIWHALFLGTYKSSHTLRVRFRIDYQEGYSAPIDLDVDANYNPSRYGDSTYGDGYYGGAGGDTTVYQREIHLNKRCQAISFEVSDVESTDTYGAAFELSELLLTGGMLRPHFPVGAARRS